MEFATARNLHLPSRQWLDDPRTVNRSRSRGCLQQGSLSRPCRSKPDCRFAATSVAPGSTPPHPTDNVANDPRLSIARAQEIIKAVLSQIDTVVVGPKYKGKIESVNTGLRT